MEYFHSDSEFSSTDELITGEKTGKIKKTSFLGRLRRKCDDIFKSGRAPQHSDRHWGRRHSRKQRGWRVGTRLRCWFCIHLRRLKSCLSRWRSHLPQHLSHLHLPSNRLLNRQPFHARHLHMPLPHQAAPHFPCHPAFHAKGTFPHHGFRSLRKVYLKSRPSLPKHVPKGFVAVYVGQEQKRFVIPVVYLNHPLFEDLLKEAEEEFGFQQSGALSIPCGIPDFEEARLHVKRSKNHATKLDSRSYQRVEC